MYLPFLLSYGQNLLNRLQNTFEFLFLQSTVKEYNYYLDALFILLTSGRVVKFWPITLGVYLSSGEFEQLKLLSKTQNNARGMDVDVSKRWVHKYDIGDTMETQ